MKVQVEMHAHGAAQEVLRWPGHLGEGETRQLQDWVQSLQIRLSTRAPWESLTMRLKMPLEHVPFVLPGVEADLLLGGAPAGARFPATGWWVVVRVKHDGPDRRHDWPAVFWGRVSAVSGSLQLGDAGQVDCVLTISAESFLAWLEHCDLVFSPHEGQQIPGAIYEIESWAAYLERVLGGFSESSAPGHLLEQVWGFLAQQRLPETLGSARLGQAVKVVHDKTSCARHAPLRLGQTLRVPGLALGVLGQVLPSGRLGDWLRSGFVADQQLVEWFPSLEFHANTWQERELLYEPEDRPALPGASVAIQNHAPRRGRPSTLSPLEEALGASPVLVYRMRPTLTDAVDGKVARDLYGAAAETVSSRLARLTDRYATYGQRPVGPADAYQTGWYDVGPDDIGGGLSFSLSDSERVNAVNVLASGLPGQEQLSLWGINGNPITLKGDIERHGLRALQVRWPFFSTGKEDVGTLYDHFSALTEQIFQMTANTGVTAQYSTWTVVLERARPWARAGHWWAVALGQGALSGLTGYGESVEHELTVGANGEFKGRTRVQLSRVTWARAGEVLTNYAPPSGGAP